jgi:hypothetical protein
MGIAQDIKIRNEFPLKRKLNELGIHPVDLANAMSKSIQYISKIINGYAPRIPEDMQEILLAQGVNLDELEIEITEWRKELKNKLTPKKKLTESEFSLEGMFTEGESISKENIDEVIKEWERE